jgi:hypothetical protein
VDSGVQYRAGARHGHSLKSFQSHQVVHISCDASISVAQRNGKYGGTTLGIERNINAVGIISWVVLSGTFVFSSGNNKLSNSINVGALSSISNSISISASHQGSNKVLLGLGINGSSLKADPTVSWAVDKGLSHVLSANCINTTGSTVSRTVARIFAKTGFANIVSTSVGASGAHSTI